MKIDYSRYVSEDYSNMKESGVYCQQKGKNAVMVVTTAENESKEKRSIKTKIARVLIESFLKRPAIRKEAFLKIAEMARNAVITEQTPKYKICCNYLMLVLKKNVIRWARMGKVSLLHFADGELVSRTYKEAPAALGENLEDEPEIYQEEILDNADHYLVLCSDNYLENVSEVAVEKCIRSANDASEAMYLLREKYTQSDGTKEVSLMTAHFPPRKKKKKIVLIIIITILVLLLAFFIVGALGRMRPM